MSRRRRRLGAVLAILTATTLTACAPGLPETVVAGTEVVVGWTGEFTSANAAASPTPGNVSVAEMTRSGFGAMVDGEFVPDASFGAVTIVRDDPFTVRFDLAEPAWSDGIPLDAADLLLGWAGATGRFDAQDETADSEASAEAEPPTDAEQAIPTVDEFARAIDVTFAEPTAHWQHAVTVPVPAHILGERAFGIDDPMAAKQAVIRAIQDDDGAALADMAEVWRTGFGVDGSEPSADVLVSSGPFIVEAVSGDADGQSVALVPNAGFRGAVTARIARVELVPAGAQPIAELGDRIDLVTLAPKAVDDDPVRELERQDFTTSTAHDGTAWSLQLNPTGVFGSPQARAAFLRAAPARDMVERGAGPWSSAYTPISALLAEPGSRAYDIVVEDSGFVDTLGTPADDPALERTMAGVGAGTPVCVLYDRTSEFAAGAFAALRDAAAEAGWSVVDCGSDDVDAALGLNGWDAVIAREPIPQTSGDIAAQWGSAGAASITGSADPERDELIAQYARTVDVYESRELLAQIEARIVREALAVPLAVSPVVTVVDRGVTGVTTPDGGAEFVTRGAAQWEVLP